MCLIKLLYFFHELYINILSISNHLLSVICILPTRQCNSVFIVVINSLTVIYVHLIMICHFTFKLPF